MFCDTCFVETHLFRQRDSFSANTSCHSILWTDPELDTGGSGKRLQECSWAQVPPEAYALAPHLGGGGAEGDSQASKALVRDIGPLPHIRQVSAYSSRYRFSSGPLPQSTLYRSLDPSLSFPSVHFANCSLPSFLRSFFGSLLPWLAGLVLLNVA